MDSLKMVLVIQRLELSPVTIGEASLHYGPIVIFRAHTLELPWLDNQRSISCIPPNYYIANKVMSPSFKQELFLLKNVPDRSGILLHSASFIRQLRGCISMGMHRLDIDNDGKIDVRRSKEAFNLFHQSCGEEKRIGVRIKNPVA